MFAAETEKLVEQLIQAEYTNACEKFGNKYNSLHEAYAILLEEVEEVEKEMSFLKRWLENSWESIKTENKYYQNECIEQLEICSTNAIKELAQVGAVLKKIQNTLKVEE
jgi:hypothetical protein